MPAHLSSRSSGRGVALLGLGQLLPALLASPLDLVARAARHLGRGEWVLRRPSGLAGRVARSGPAGHSLGDRGLVALVGREVVALAVKRLGQVTLLDVG